MLGLRWAAPFPHYIWNLARVKLFLCDFADFAGTGIYQRGCSAGELARPSGRHQNIPVIAVETIFELHAAHLCVGMAVGD